MLIPLLALVSVQLCLHNPQTRELFTDIEKQENITYEALKQDETETVEVMLIGSRPCESVKLIYNGRYICPFDFTTMKIPVECSGVLQIRNDSGQALTVAVISKSKNVKITDVDLYHDAGISTICRVEITG